MGRRKLLYDELSEERKKKMSKAELERRKIESNRLISGIKLQEFDEVKNNKKAHEEFERVDYLFQLSGLNDDLFAGPLNRYCLLKAECEDFTKKREKFYSNIDVLEKEYEEEKITAKEYFNLILDLEKQIVKLDNQVQAKRNMMLAIEKENIMTVLASQKINTLDDTEEEVDANADMFE